MRTCPRCRNTTRWQHFERYRYLSLFFVRLARWRREQLDGCPICGHTEPQASPAPRRLMHRLGRPAQV